MKEENIYFSIKLLNDTNDAIKATKSQSINPIITNQKEYKIACTSFKLDIDAPIGFQLIEEGNAQTDINRTIEGLCLHDLLTNTYHPINVQYLPFNSYHTPPLSPAQNNGKQDFSNYYYGIYNISQWIQMVNNAFILSYQNLKFINPANPINTPPYIFNRENVLCFVCDQSYIGNCDIYINTYLNKKLGKIPSFFYGHNQPNYCDSRLLIDPATNSALKLNYYNDNNNQISNNSGGGNDIILIQESNTLNEFQNIESIVFISNSIETEPEYIDNNSNNLQQDAQKILTSFNIFYDNISLSLNKIIFNAQIYKYINLISTSPLNYLNINIYFRLYNGVLIPVLINPKSSCDIKFILQKNEN